MDREDQRQVALCLDQSVDQPDELGGIIDIGRPVQGHHAVAAALQLHLAGRVRGFDRGPDQLETVDHDVADPADARFGHAFGEQIFVTIGRRRPEHARQRIRDEPVQFLGHGPVAAAQAGFKMDDGNGELGAGQRASGGGIDVANDHQPVWPVGQGHFFIGDHHAAGLFGMAARADAEMEIGLRQLQVREEGTGHIRVIMLAGMDQHRRKAGVRRERVPERRDLHEIGPHRGDQMDALDHGRCHSPQGLTESVTA